MMAAYRYTARDPAGNELSGVYANVNGIQALRADLTRLGYVLVDARPERRPHWMVAYVPQKEVALFVYKFAGMYSAGLPLVRSLETLERQTANLSLRHVMADVRHRVETGSSLMRAFEPYRKLFGDFFIGMIEAGESAGKLSEALEMSARYLEKRLELRQKTRAAFVYPAVVGVVCSLVVLCLLIFVVPTFSQLYSRLHVELPGPTRALVTLSVVLRRWWWALSFVGVGLTLAVRRLVSLPGARVHLDRLKLRLPVLGPLNRLIAVSRFVRTFGMLISVGVPVIDALGVASDVAHNHVITQITGELQKATRAGRSIGQSLAEYPIFPPVVVQMAASGEEAGLLAEMLEKSVELLDKDIDRMTASLLVKLEPALTVVMGLIIGLILMGVYLPMFDYMARLQT